MAGRAEIPSESRYSSPARRLVPVWLRVPGHVDLSEVADEHLVDELKRRGFAVFPAVGGIVLPGLTVHDDGEHCVWRGVRVRLTPREHQLVSALAAAYPRALTGGQVALCVWGAAYKTLNAQILANQVRRRWPGLLCAARLGSHRNYRLDLDGGA